jgi:molecular chaperone IbpA
MAGDRLVHRIVDDLGSEVVERSLVGAADVHTGAAAHGLEAFEDFDRGCVIAVGGRGRGRGEEVGHSPSAIGRGFEQCQGNGEPFSTGLETANGNSKFCGAGAIRVRDGAACSTRSTSLRQSLNQEDKTMRSAFDFAPFRRSTVGFDRLFDMLENNGLSQGQENYPPFDLIKLGDNDYRIELAVAGFKPDELDITAQQNVLLVTGRKKDEDEQKGSNYVYRGIATRSFERRFALADHIQVRGADMKDGLLSIELKREIPEAMKLKKINIGGSERKPETIEAKAEKTPAPAETEHA